MRAYLNNRWSLALLGALTSACTVTTVEPGDESAAGAGGSGAGGSSSGGGSAGTEVGSAGSGGSGSGGGGAFDCGDRDATDAIVVDSDITDSTTWSGTIVVDAAIDVYDAVLTIEAGTRILMGTDADIELGWNGSTAGVQALGTEADPIRICGRQAEAGYWSSIIVRGNVTSDSVLRNVLIADGGGSDAALVLDADLTVDNVQVDNSGGDGVWAVDFRSGSQGLSVRGSQGAAVVLTGPGAATRFPLGGELVENEEDLARVRFADIDEDTTFHALGIPYLQERAMDVTEAAVEFEAGVEYRFLADTDLEVGWNGSDATLTVSGTEAEPVVFRGQGEEAGYWAGVVVQRNVRSDSVMRHARILHAGGSDAPALSLDAPILLDHVSLEQNETGVFISGEGLHADSRNLSVTTTESDPLVIEPDALTSLPEGGTFTGNTRDRIVVEGGDYSRNGTVPNLGVPYFIRGSIDTLADSVLQLTAGTQFTMNADVDIEIGWNGSAARLVAEGTADDPIHFTGLDTTTGYWRGLVVGQNVLSSSLLDHVEVSHGGGATSNPACLQLRTAITVTNSSFVDCGGFGILKDDADAADYTVTNTFTNMGSGSVGTL